MPSPRAYSAVLTVGVLALVLTGCGGAGEPAATPSAPATASPEASPEIVQPTATATAAPAGSDATCETLISDVVLGDLEAQGWTYKEEPLAVAGTEIKGGILCTWADFSTATGNLLMFGWGPIAADDARKAENTLVSQGWTVEDAEEGVYVTEDPTQSPTTDENGYGMTYQFGREWVTVSDTKQGLLLITRPGT